MSDAIANSEQIIAYAKDRPEIIWHWGGRLNRVDAEAQGFALAWGEPIRPGDTYLAKRNTGWKLLTCRDLGEACVYPVEMRYAFDFNECVKVVAVL